VLLALLIVAVMIGTGIGLARSLQRHRRRSFARSGSWLARWWSSRERPETVDEETEEPAPKRDRAVPETTRCLRRSGGVRGRVRRRRVRRGVRGGRGNPNRSTTTFPRWRAIGSCRRRRWLGAPRREARPRGDRRHGWGTGRSARGPRRRHPRSSDSRRSDRDALTNSNSVRASRSRA